MERDGKKDAYGAVTVHFGAIRHSPTRGRIRPLRYGPPRLRKRRKTFVWPSAYPSGAFPESRSLGRERGHRARARRA
jgi:hypothetical protein